jgi:plasmid stability protein
MSQIMIRNLDPAVIEALHRGADTCGTSMKEQASRAQIKAVGRGRQAATQRLAEMRRLIGHLEGPSVLDDLRRDRRRDQE